MARHSRHILLTDADPNLSLAMSLAFSAGSSFGSAAWMIVLSRSPKQPDLTEAAILQFRMGLDSLRRAGMQHLPARSVDQPTNQEGDTRCNSR